MLIIPEHSYEDGGWCSEGFKQNPGAGVLLADTGPLIKGLYSFTVLFASFTGANMWAELQHRNAVNNATLHCQRIQCYFPNPPMPYPFLLHDIDEDERIRCVMITAGAVDIQVSILWARRYS